MGTHGTPVRCAMAFVRAAGFEALLFILGRVVDWLASTRPRNVVRLATLAVGAGALSVNGMAWWRANRRQTRP
jgi:hypothetical protein